MDYQGVLGRFTYDNGTDIRNRISAVEAGDYRENRDIINEIVLWKMNRRPQVTEELIDAIFSLKEIKTPLQVLMDEKTERVVEKLLQTKGMQLPMASTVLHFYYPEIFPIIDQEGVSGALCYGLSQNDDEDPHADRALSQVHKRLLGVSTGEVPGNCIFSDR